MTKISIDLVSWKRYGFEKFSIDLDELQLEQFNSTLPLIILDGNNNDYYELSFNSKVTIKLYVRISKFEYVGKTYYIIAYESDSINPVPAENYNEYGRLATVRMPEYLQITDLKEIATYKAYRRYENSDYYQGILFNENNNWLSTKMSFKTTLNRFTHKYLKELISKMSQPFTDPNTHILYNFITSCLRDPESDYLLVPPVISQTTKDNSWAT